MIDKFSIVSCGASVGIANQPDLWETIRSPHVKIYRSAIKSISESSSDNAGQLGQGFSVSLTDDETIEDIDLVVHATGYWPIVPVKFEPPSFRLTIGLSGLVVDDCQSKIGKHKDRMPDSISIPSDSTTQDQLHYWRALDTELEPAVRQTLMANGCTTTECTRSETAMPFRLFRRMVAPKLIAEGDRSFATLGVVRTSTIAVVAEVQALWVTAFLTGGFDNPSKDTAGLVPKSLDLTTLSKVAMDRGISEDVVLGSLTDSSLVVDAIPVSTFPLRKANRFNK